MNILKDKLFWILMLLFIIIFTIESDRYLTLSIIGLLLLPFYFFIYRYFRSNTIKTLEEKSLKKDIELTKREALLNNYKKAVDESTIVSKTDKNGIITYVNEQFTKISGYSEEELIGKPHSIIRHPDMPTDDFKGLWESVLNKKTWKGIVKNRKKNGEDYIVNTTVVPILDSDDEIVEFMGIRHNITDLIETEKKLQEQRINPLTNLLNRYALMNDLKEYKAPAFAIIDVDSFEQINDFFGTVVGDCVLIQLSKIVSKFFDDDRYIVYKLPIDQYGVLLKDSSEMDRFVVELKELSKEINGCEFNCQDNEIFLNVTVGVAKEGSVYQFADMALNQAKRLNKSFCTYSQDCNMSKLYENNLTWTKKLKKAMKSNNIVSFYQPIVNNKTLKIEKHECLVRMLDGDKVISPFFFLDIAKRAKIYPRITRIVFSDMIKALKKSENIQFTINFTTDDIENPLITDLIKTTLKKEQLAHRVIIEITESEEVKNYEKMLEITKEFKEMGCKIAIDDFGSGYSNFTYLMDIDADIIKIDGSLIKNIDRDKNSYAIVESIVAFAKKMDIETVAEFVSSKEIYEVTKELGVDYSQGFFFGEPRLEPHRDILRS